MNANNDETMVYLAHKATPAAPAGLVKAWESDGQGGGMWVHVTPAEAQRMADEDARLEMALARSRSFCYVCEQGGDCYRCNGGD